MKTRISSLTKHTDAELTKLIYEGEYVAFDVLMERYHEMLFLFIINFVRNEQNAQDVIQNTWMLVMAEFEHGHYRETGGFKWWLRKIARREALHWLRVERRHGMTVTTVKMSKAKALVISNMNAIRNPRLAEALKTISAKAQFIIDRHFFKKMTFKEIALELNLTVGAVTNAYSRALEKMRWDMNIEILLRRELRRRRY